MGLDPIRKDFRCVDGVQIVQMHIVKSGTNVKQHSHVYPHTSMLAIGSVRLWKDGEPMGDFKAPQPIFIEEHCKHTFMSLEDNTIIYCIHNISRSGDIEIFEEAKL